MKLEKYEEPPRVSYVGKETFTMDDTSEVKLELSGEELLDEKPPEGTSWRITFTVRIEEFGA
jgi:hypothetical protein